MKEEFYTEKRWLNLLNRVKESKFTLEEAEDKNTGAIFVNIMDDVVLACLKVIARCEREIIPPEEAISELENIRTIVLKDHESMGEDADLMLTSLKTSLEAVFVSCQRYIAGDFDNRTGLAQLVKDAIRAEEQEKMEDAFDILSQIGARIIGGEALPEQAIAELPYSMTAELMDGIDAISAALIGDDSYKEDDGTEDSGEDL